jgi:hypothetical protein
MMLKLKLNEIVHCKMGVSRSASVVTAYIMKELGFDYERAFAYVKQRRACVNPNESFRSQLRTYESILQAHKAKYSLFEPSSSASLSTATTATTTATTASSSSSLLLAVGQPSSQPPQTTPPPPNSDLSTGLSVREAVNKIKSMSAIDQSSKWSTQ